MAGKRTIQQWRGNLTIMFTFHFYIFGWPATVTSSNNGTVGWCMDNRLNSYPEYMSLREFREVFGSCSVIGCDHLTLGDYLPLS